MKRILLSILLLIIFTYSLAQSDSITGLNMDSITVRISELVDYLASIQRLQVKSNRYKMYPTENLYNFLELDRQTGRIKIVQWSLESKKEFSIYLNRKDLSGLGLEGVNSFELYPTQNMYQFILLDKATGRTWHVQWGFSDDKRWIRSIDY